MTTSQRVANILAVSQRARDDDLELWLIFAQKFGLALNEMQIALLRKMPSFETIRRIRQKYQQEGKYPASLEAEKRRYKRFKNVRANIVDSEPDNLMDLLERE